MVTLFYIAVIFAIVIMLMILAIIVTGIIYGSKALYRKFTS